MVDNQPTSRNARYAVLDILRFAAAIWVMLYHYGIYMTDQLSVYLGKLCDFGYLGVNFFFILSGFVIIASAENRSAISFAISRVLRLYPAFWVCLGITVTSLIIFSDRQFAVAEIVANALILNDYFGISNIDQVFWTLQAEVKFYALVFLLMAVGLIKYTRIWISVWLLVAITHFYIQQPFFLGWIISPSYSFYFIGGICSYLLTKNRSDMYVWAVWMLALIFAVAKSRYQITEFLPSADHLDSIVAACLVVVFFVFFMLLSLGRFAIRGKAWMLTIGAASYPLYLIHGAAGRALIDYSSPFFGVGASVVSVMIIVIALSLIIAAVIEPAIRGLFKGLVDRIRPA